MVNESQEFNKQDDITTTKQENKHVRLIYMICCTSVIHNSINVVPVNMTRISDIGKFTISVNHIIFRWW